MYIHLNPNMGTCVASGVRCICKRVACRVSCFRMVFWNKPWHRTHRTWTWRDLCQVPGFFVAADFSRAPKEDFNGGQMIPLSYQPGGCSRRLLEHSLGRFPTAMARTFRPFGMSGSGTSQSTLITPMFGTGQVVIINLARDHWCLQLTKWSTPNKTFVRFLGNQSGHPSFQLLIQIGSQHFLHFLHFTATENNREPFLGS